MRACWEASSRYSLGKAFIKGLASNLETWPRYQGPRPAPNHQGENVYPYLAMKGGEHFNLCWTDHYRLSGVQRGILQRLLEGEGTCDFRKEKTGDETSSAIWKRSLIPKRGKSSLLKHRITRTRGNSHSGISAREEEG